ncbi:F-box/LRR-repeat protein 5 isoform X1 [Latimeria chalumnae]|uniref:F-box/LRR-repeat protein 5 isoform X1 n=1 Tax=Latimeria chalumnae TaxID=7897 RepID=UPI0006D901B5|nr:PREDICTED: F-box/LRR-repeat protein 5 [Latimeria chalumnae]|eukprot:XP_014347589.1 PREDICTED: F-box/LRR-repeat protein 5 [Latimeria chalumnae]
MAPFPEEVDVFTGPHWRMKQLVGLYCEKLSKTNFSNNNDFRALLQSLYATFKEFKMHEQIENEYIIGLLQQRSQTIYNVHSDNKLSEMLSLFEKGLKNVKNEYEQLNYAKQLKERLEAFTRDFLPHMKEEEEVFQPMLMEYFTYEELKDIKKNVIAQHCSQRRWDTAELLKGLSLWNQAEELHKAFKYSVDEKTDQDRETPVKPTHVSQLPPELMLKIFSYLTPQEMCYCSQVCTNWSDLAKTGTLWRHLFPVLWARGEWYSGPPGGVDLEPSEDWVKNEDDECRAFQERDEDADVDESEEAANKSLAVSVAQREKNLLQGLIQNLLPLIGPFVKMLVLAYSSAISSKMVRQMLELCPNLEYLDLTQTNITDSAFDSWSTVGSCSTLRHLDLSGCEKVTDVALEKISKALGDFSSYYSSVNAFKSHRKKAKCTELWQRQRHVGMQFSRGYWARDLSKESFLREESECGFLNRNASEKCSAADVPVWRLNKNKLVDIEDAAEWRLRSVEELSFVETSSRLLCARSGCCSRDGFGIRTSACWQRLATPAALAHCGHLLCSGGMALRTTPPSPESSVLCNLGIRTKQSEERDFTHHRGEKFGLEAPRVLQFLSLSGCYQITDHGLRALALGGGLPVLEHLNLSGCLIVTGAGLQDLVSACPKLNDEHFYYCDNINGPHAETASGCQNLQCGIRACCRSGE